MDGIVDIVFGQLLGYSKDGVDPGYGAVSTPMQNSDGSWEIVLMDLATMSKPVAVITIKESTTNADCND